MCLAKAATIIRNEILCKSESKNRNIEIEKFSRQWENQVVSQPLLSFIEMALNGSDVVNDTNKESDAALTIAQLLHLTRGKAAENKESMKHHFLFTWDLWYMPKLAEKAQLRSFLNMD